MSDSPLTAAGAAAESASSIEQRACDRRPIDVHVTLRDPRDRILICRVVDISSAGAQLRCDRSSAMLLEQNLAAAGVETNAQALQVSLSFRCLDVSGVRRCVHADAAIVYLREVDSDDFRVGLAFTEAMAIDLLQLCQGAPRLVYSPSHMTPL